MLNWPCRFESQLTTLIQLRKQTSLLIVVIN